MKATTQTATVSATATCTLNPAALAAIEGVTSLMWKAQETEWEISIQLAVAINESKGDLKAVGAAIGASWSKVGGEVETGRPARHLIAACALTTLDRKGALALANAAEIVTKQRVSQLVAAIYDNGKTKPVKAPLTPLQKILAEIGKADGFTMDDAKAVAQAISAKVKAAPAATATVA